MTHKIGFILVLAATILSLAVDIEKKEIKINLSNPGITHTR